MCIYGSENASPVGRAWYHPCSYRHHRRHQMMRICNSDVVSLKRTTQLAAAASAAAVEPAPPRGRACIGHINAQSMTNKIDDIILLLKKNTI